MQLSMIFFTAVAAMVSHEVNKQGYTYVGGCKLNGPGAVQTAAGGGSDGTVDGIAPAQNVYKDGFWSVGCKGDAMIKIGDKYGGGKFKYDIGRVANTSVVRYDMVVEGDSQESMTPSVCFEFCRTVPNMNFFGLINGRDCYCEHYYQTTSAEGTCDLPCEGDSASICGGSDMSSLYQMHVCEGGLAADAKALEESAMEVYDAMSTDYDAVDEVASAMQASGEMLESFAEGCTSDYSQQAKVAAGPLSRVSEGLAEVMGKLDEADSKEMPPLDGELSFDDRKVVEEHMETVTDLLDAGEQALSAATELYDESCPDLGEESADAASTFVPVLRQLGDASRESDQSVCAGTVTGLPKVGLTYDQCAYACDHEAPKSSDAYCWAFQYIAFPDAEPLCFLLSDLTELTTYKCASSLAGGSEEGGSPDPDAFLQISKANPSPEPKVSFLAKKHRHHKHRHGHKHHHKGLSHKHHHKAHKKMVRKANAHAAAAVNHQLVRKMKIQKRELSEAYTDEPEVMCAVRFADVQGVTPEFKDGTTNIDRCFAAE